MSSSLQLYGLKHIRLLCPPLSPGVCSTSCPLSWWCHPNHLTPCCPLLILPSVFPSIKIFSSESHQVTKVLELQHQPFQYSLFRLISFRIDCVDLLAVQRTIKNQLYVYPLSSLARPPPHPTPTSHSSRWSWRSLCCIAATHYLSILHMVVWKIFLRGKILLVFQKSQDLDSFVLSKHFFLIPIFLSANTSEFYF